MLVATHSPFLPHSPFSDSAQSKILGPAPAPAPAPERLQLQPSQPVDNLILVPPQEKLLASQLAHLASQHHTSEYNRLKFGPKGSPVPYAPLSLELPEHVKQLQARQAFYVKQRAWWPSDHERKRKKLDVESRMLQVQNGQSGGSPQLATQAVVVASTDIREEISAAIASPLPMIPRFPSIHTAKTSESHPINISMVIPFELLPTISSHLTRTPNGVPTLFTLPQNYYLDRVTAVPIPGAHTFAYPKRPPNYHFVPAFRPDSFSAYHFRPPSIIWSRNNESAHNAVNGKNVYHASPNDGNDGFPPPPPFFVPSQRPRQLMTESPPVPVRSELPSPKPLQVHTSLNQPSGGVVRHPKHMRALSAPPTLPVGRKNTKDLRNLPRNRSHPNVGTDPMQSAGMPGVPSSALGTKHLSDDMCPPVPAQASNSGTSSPLVASLTQNPMFLKKPEDYNALMQPPSLPSQVEGQVPAQQVPMPASSPTGPRIGNLYLSSCPGKKVRLSGPVRGRSAICRDLYADLSRIKDLGVGCIICCLDDDELDFLGASWAEYSRVANELGLDVLRLPTPEGLAPLTPASIDGHLKWIIQEYTLKGIPILAHCRGGVGRAGLVACCWLLKLGLCGWKDSQLCSRTTECCAWGPKSVDASTSSLNGDKLPVVDQVEGLEGEYGAGACLASVRLVERVIAVVRRRRSLKAVETYEQVKFLVDFVEHLDAMRSGPDYVE